MTRRALEPLGSPTELLRRYAAGERVFENAELRGAHLAGAILSKVHLEDADLTGASLTGADLSQATLDGANLRRADLRHANLAHSRMNGAILRGADLRGANLTRTNLSRADLTRANVTGADFAGAILAGTYLLELDLSPLCEASSSIEHRGPSRIDHVALLMSLQAPGLKEFLLRTGLPALFAEYMVDCARAINDVDVFKMMQSTFISYGGPDEPFARKLYEALHRNGVTTFFFPEHAAPGEKLHRVMRKGINEHERMILICSESSLQRRGVLNEIEEVLTREARDGGASYLIPIRLDDYVFTGWHPPNPDVAQAIRDRVVADFTGTDADQAKFDAQLLKVLSALKSKRVGA